MTYLLLFLTALFVIPPSARAEKVKVSDIETKEDTSIVIKKGDPGMCVEYSIVDGHEDVFGSPDFDRAKAYGGWKTACNEWKQSMRELNKENSILSLSCAAPTGGKESDQWVFKGIGTYKIRVKTRDKK